MKFGSDTVLSKKPSFLNFGLSHVITTDKMGSVIFPTTRFEMSKNGSNWIRPGIDIEEATANGVRKTKANNHYNFKFLFWNYEKILRFWAEKYFYESTNVGLKSFWHEYDQQNNVTNWLDSSRGKNPRVYVADMTNIISKAKWKSACTRGPRPRPIIVRIFIK